MAAASLTGIQASFRTAAAVVIAVVAAAPVAAVTILLVELAW